MYDYPKCHVWGAIKPQSPLIKNLINGKKVQGWTLPQLDEIEVVPQIVVKSLQT